MRARAFADKGGVAIPAAVVCGLERGVQPADENPHEQGKTEVAHVELRGEDEEEVAEAAKQLGMEEGMHEATVAAIHKTINMLRRMKRSPKQILQELEQDYGNEFSEEELADFVKNA